MAFYNDILIPIPSILALYDRMTKEANKNEDNNNVSVGIGGSGRYSIINSMGGNALFNEYGDDVDEIDEDDNEDNNDNNDNDDDSDNNNFFEDQKNDEIKDTRSALLDGSYDRNLKICTVVVGLDRKIITKVDESRSFINDLRNFLYMKGSNVLIFVIFNYDFF
jgi:hypothetical protein